MTLAQLIPISEVPSQVLDFGDALAVRGIGAAPRVERVEIEVLAVQVDSLGVNQPVNVRGEPIPGVRVAKVQQPAVGAADHPFRMLLGQPRAGMHSLRLEPDNGPEVLRVGIIAHFAQAVRKAPGIHFPRARLPPPKPIARIPPGVHPPIIRFQILFDVPINKLDLIPGRRVAHLGELMRTASRMQDRRRPAPGPWHVMGDHPTPP